MDISKSHLGPQWQDVSTFHTGVTEKRVPLMLGAGGWASLCGCGPQECALREVEGASGGVGDMYTRGQVMLMYGKRP